MSIRLIGLLVIMGCSLNGWAQQSDHFIYLQSDTKQSFYVRLHVGADPISSSASGYLIMPKVAQGSFSFWVGFPDNSFPEQHFVCAISADKGFLLKRFPDKGWALYDLQELTLNYAIPADSGKPAPPPDSSKGVSASDSAKATTPVVSAPDPTSTSGASALTQTGASGAGAPDTNKTKTAAASSDAFGDMLAAVTRDSSLKDVQTVKKVVPPKDPPKVAPAVKGAAAITLISSQTTDTGVQQVYVDKQASGKIDTVQILLPVSAVDSAGQTGISSPGPQGGNSAMPPTGGNMATVTSSAGATTPPAGMTGATNPSMGTTTPTTGMSGATNPSTGTTIPADATSATPSATTASSGTTTTPPAIVAPTAPTPVDTSHAFDPASVVKHNKSKDTSNFVVPVFKQQDSGAANSSAQPLNAGFGVQPAASASASPAGGGGLANTDCKHVASDDDYLKLRKKMASESDVDHMIELARKSFRKSCFTSDQVRSLSFLFLQEDGRYKFIEEAYPFVSDSGNFKQLQSLFSSVYFINRFKALVQR
jgi:hypothetical protein